MTNQSFLRAKDITKDHGAENTIATMLMLGRSLNLKTIVEGVETMEQSEWLKPFGCFQQGYFFSKPLDRVKSLQMVA